ncbi:MAG: lipid kinase [Rubrobacteraceae bacterium]
MGDALDVTPVRRSALVVNTRARNGERAFSEALGRLEALGLSLDAAHAVRDPARLPEVVRDLLAESYDLVILGGGDGSVSSVVDFFPNREAVLGLLPLGTANDFARTLGISFGLQRACETIVRGKIVDVDLGLAGDNYYVNVASAGLGVGVTQALSAGLKKHAGVLAYSVAALKAFLAHEPFSVRLTFPDGDHEPVEHDRLLQVAVGNGRFYGGGMVVAPDSGMDDRTLDLYTIRLGRHRDLVGVVRYLKSGDFISNGSVQHYRTRRVVLETEPGLPINVDGEIVAHTPLEFSVAPNALKVIVPRESHAAHYDAS